VTFVLVYATLVKDETGKRKLPYARVHLLKKNGQLYCGRHKNSAGQEVGEFTVELGKVLSEKCIKGWLVCESCQSRARQYARDHGADGLLKRLKLLTRQKV